LTFVKKYGGEMTMFEKELTEEQRQRSVLLENRAWLHTNFEKIKKEYAETWVAILDKKIAVQGEDVEVVKNAIRDRSAEAVIMRIPSGDVPTPI